MQNTTVPTRPEAEVITSALWPAILDHIHHDDRIRQRVRFGRLVVAAVALAGSGLLIGATVLAPAFNPGGGQLYGADGQLSPATFAVDCHTSSPPGSPGGMTDQYSAQADINKVITNFQAACESKSRSVSIQDAIFNGAQQQRATGLSCGIVSVPGTEIGYWEHLGGSSQDLSIVTGSEPRNDWPANCRTTITVKAAPIPTGPVAVCAIASNWAVVYLRGNETTSEICAKAGYPTWGK